MKNKLQILLDRLSKVKSTGADKWVACCPAHQDKSPSLAITLKADKILLHCFGGCDVSDILESVGMTLLDLFPENVNVNRKENRTYFSHEQILLALHDEILVSSIILGMIGSGIQLTSDELDRASLASQRIIEAINNVT